MAQGIFLGIISQFLFRLLYLFSLWLQPLNGTDVFAWRMVMMVFGLFLIIFPTVGCRSLSKLVNETLGKDKNVGCCFRSVHLMLAVNFGYLCGRLLMVKE